MDEMSAQNERFEKMQIVAIGGGTGLPSMLRGFKAKLGPNATQNLTAIVTMTDDGGSSGRLRRGLGVLPPGDLRNCMVALAHEEDLFSNLFQHRFKECEELSGHTLGNLILAALSEQSGSFQRAIEMSSQVLRIKGRILPATLDNVQLEAITAAGKRLKGESTIGRSHCELKEIQLEPSSAKPAPGVLEAIESADLIVLGPGSLYTSIVPNLLVHGVGQALRRSKALKIFVGNLVHEPGEGHSQTGVQHLEVLESHAGGPFVDGVLVHDGSFDALRLERYIKEGARPLDWSTDNSKVPIYRAALLSEGKKFRHDPQATVEAIHGIWLQHRRGFESQWGRSQ